MTRGNQREIHRAKILARQADKAKGLRTDDGLTHSQRQCRYAEVLREKQKKKEAVAAMQPP